MARPRKTEEEKAETAANAKSRYAAKQSSMGKRRIEHYTAWPKGTKNLELIQFCGSWPDALLSGKTGLKLIMDDTGRITIEQVDFSSSTSAIPSNSQNEKHSVDGIAAKPDASRSSAIQSNSQHEKHLVDGIADKPDANQSADIQSNSRNEKHPVDGIAAKPDASRSSAAQSNSQNEKHIDHDAGTEPFDDDDDAPVPPEIQAEMGEIYNLFLQNEPEFPADESDQSHPDSDTEPPADDGEDDSWVSDIPSVTRDDILWAVKKGVAPKFFRPSDNTRVEREIAEREEDESFLFVCKFNGIDTPLRRAAFARSKAGAMPAAPRSECQEKCTTEDIDLDAELQPEPKGLTPERIAELEAEYEKQEREYEIEQEKRKEQEPPEKTWLDEMEEFRQRCLRDKERRRRKYFPDEGDEDDEAEGNGESKKDDDDDD